MEYRDVAPPVMEKGRAILRIRRTGISWYGYSCLLAADQPYLSIPASWHELSGDLVDADGAEGFAPEEAVTFIPYYHCGQCNACSR